jgi:hypothetical protein
MKWLLFVLGAIFPTPTQAAQPTVDSIDYSAPESYLEIAETLGDRERIMKQALKLKGRDDQATVRRVMEWMDTELSYDADKAYTWRNFDDVVREGCYGGCADQGIACGVLLKALGIPTVWVKTMDVSWIWDFKKGRPYKSWSGHVFLEIYLDGKWVLLDPGAKLIYPDYSPKARILPGNRFAYDKGSDPKQMIMSLQWEEWKAQTRSYFSQLDGSLLPIDTASSVSVVPQVYIIGNDPYYKVIAEMARSKGWSVQRSFNTDYENLLPLTKGQTLLIETHRGKPIISFDILHKVFPGAAEGLKSADGVIEIQQTTIMFVELAKLLNVLEQDKGKDAAKPPTGDG